MNPQPLMREYLQRLKTRAHQRFLAERAADLAVQCANFVIYKAKQGHLTATWGAPADKMNVYITDTLILTVSSDILIEALKEKMPDVDIIRYECQGYTQFLLDWS